MEVYPSLHEAFEDMDENGSHVLSMHEFSEAVSRLLKVDTDDARVIIASHLTQGSVE